jgi:hypothetical protein
MLLKKKIKDLSAEQRHLIRLEKSQPILDDLKQWCEQSVTKTSKDTVLGKAIRYTLNQWIYLTRYLEEGELTLITIRRNGTSNRLCLDVKIGCSIKHPVELMPAQYFTVWCKPR